MALQLLGARILIKPEVMGDKTEGGIIIPDAFRERTDRAKVFGIGPGHRMSSGKLYPVCVKPGDTIFYSKGAGTPVMDGDQEYLIIEDENVIAIIKEPKK